MSQTNQRVPETVLITSQGGRWLVSNVVNEPAASFFQEIFRPGDDGQWERLDAHAVRDTANRERWAGIMADAEVRVIDMPATRPNRLKRELKSDRTDPRG